MIKAIFMRSFLIFCILSGAFCRPSEENTPEVPIIKLIKTGEIPNIFSTLKDEYFWNIDGITCDDENNLYVSDSGWNKVFKFDPQRRFLMSFGQTGQGPGDFMGEPHTRPLRISFGRDKKIYVLDSGNQRVNVFSKEGRFLGLRRIERLLNDSPAINSKGDLFIISRGEKHVVDCIDSEGRTKEEILDYDEFYRNRFFAEPKEFPRLVNDVKLLKAIGPDDHLFILSNLRLEIFHYDEKCRFMNKFLIRNDRLLNDFKIRLQAALAKRRYAQAFLNISVDNSNKLLYLIYFNGATKKPEIYRYRRDGFLHDILLIPDEYTTLFSMDTEENFYAVFNTESGTDAISIYKINLKY